MKYWLTSLIALAYINIGAFQKIDPQEWKNFQEKYPVLAAIPKHNASVLKDLKREVNYKQIKAIKLHKKAPKLVQENIKKNNTGVEVLAAFIPLAAFTGAKIRTHDWQPLINTLTKTVAIKSGINALAWIIKQGILPESVTTAHISGCGLAAHADIRYLLEAYLQHIETNGIEISAKNTQKFAAILTGTCVAHIYKINNNYTLHLPGTRFILLKDDQAVHIAARSAGSLIKQGKIPGKSEVAYELFQKTTAEVGYNILAQLLHKIAQQSGTQKYLEPFIPKDCTPKNFKQYVVKMGINEIICSGVSAVFDFSFDATKIDLSDLGTILGARYDS